MVKFEGRESKYIYIWVGKRKENISLICNLEKEIKGEKNGENLLLYLLFGLEKGEKRRGKNFFKTLMK